MAKAQFNVRPSTVEKDIFGNSSGKVAHRDAYGNVTVTSTTKKDFFGIVRTS